MQDCLLSTRDRECEREGEDWDRGRKRRGKRGRERQGKRTKEMVLVTKTQRERESKIGKVLGKG